MLAERKDLLPRHLGANEQLSRPAVRLPGGGILPRAPRDLHIFSLPAERKIRAVIVNRHKIAFDRVLADIKLESLSQELDGFTPRLVPFQGFTRGVVVNDMLKADHLARRRTDENLISFLFILAVEPRGPIKEIKIIFLDELNKPGKTDGILQVTVGLVIRGENDRRTKTRRVFLARAQIFPGDPGGLFPVDGEINKFQLGAT